MEIKNVNDPVEQLDMLLWFISSHWMAKGRVSESEILIGLQKTGYQISAGDLTDAIRQLCDDGYINERNLEDHETYEIRTTYRATWAGKYFQRTSGYQKKIDEAEMEKRAFAVRQSYEWNQNRKMRKLSEWNLHLTIGAAMTAAVVCYATVWQANSCAQQTDILMKQYNLQVAEMSTKMPQPVATAIQEIQREIQLLKTASLNKSNSRKKSR